MGSMSFVLAREQLLSSPGSVVCVYLLGSELN